MNSSQDLSANQPITRHEISRFQQRLPGIGASLLMSGIFGGAYYVVATKTTTVEAIARVIASFFGG